MRVLWTVYFIHVFYYAAKGFMLLKENFTKEVELSRCVSKILTSSLRYGSQITVFDINSDSIEVVKEINFLKRLSIVSKNISSNRNLLANEAYFLMAREPNAFTKHVSKLIHDKHWDPAVRFFILINYLNFDSLKELFQVLMQHHVIHAIVLGYSLNLYTYNPFDNYGCGKRFEEVISLGSCLQPQLPNLFPEKLVTGLRNCTFRVLSSNYPPYTIVPAMNPHVRYPGADQCALNWLAELEHFKLNYTFLDNAEEFSTVNEEMEAIGPLRHLQNNEFDIVIGGMILIPSRAYGFTYLAGHMAFCDGVRIVVPSASMVPKWKKFHTEFQVLVWIALIFTFFVYAAIVVALINKRNPNYRSSVVLKLWDNIFMHGGANIPCKFSVRCVLILWIWFTFLVNSFYQTSLTSLTTTRGTEYQVKTMDDLILFGYKTCISPVMQTYMSNSMVSQGIESDADCQDLYGSLVAVSKSKCRYTIVPEYFYEFVQGKLIADRANSLCVFPKPLNKLITAFYLYKGFPKHRKLQIHTIRMREHGLIDYCLKRLNKYAHLVIHNLDTFVVKLSDLVIPFSVLLIGINLAIIVLFIEIAVRHKIYMEMVVF